MVKMREYILTENDRKLIKSVLEGAPLNGFRVLKYYAKRALPQLEEDLELVKKFLEVTGE